jgi:hypothetical protein
VGAGGEGRPARHLPLCVRAFPSPVRAAPPVPPPPPLSPLSPHPFLAYRSLLPPCLSAQP